MTNQLYGASKGWAAPNFSLAFGIEHFVATWRHVGRYWLRQIILLWASSDLSAGPSVSNERNPVDTSVQLTIMLEAALFAAYFLKSTQPRGKH